MGSEIRIHDAVKPFVEEIVRDRRHFHQYPELSFQEHNTAERILQILQPLDLDIRHPVAKTGIVATLENGPGPIIGLRADMDALPIQETSDAPYKSQHDGVMHACGHDGHMAILLGALRALHARRDLWSGTVKFIFQPAEEGFAGARVMVQEGALENPHISQIFGLHLWNYQSFGTVGVRSGPTLAASDRFQVRIEGVGGHGAAPQGTIDAVYVAAQLVTAFHGVVGRNLDPLDSGVVTVGEIHSGSGFNIIAKQAELRGTVRAYREEVRALLRRRLEEISAGLATASGARIDFEYFDGYPPTVNDPTMSELVRVCARDVVGEAGVGDPYMSMGGEDMSYFLQERPGCFFFVGSRPPERATTEVPHHCPHFDIDERSLAVGASVFVRIVERCLPPGRQRCHN